VRVRPGPQLVRVGDPAGEDEPVVFARVGVADDPVDPEFVALVEVVEGLDLTALWSQQVGVRTRLAHRAERLGELDLLDALVGGQEGDLLSP
jgi:hypothetical protein